MFHKDRHYCIKCCASLEELVADMLKERLIYCQAWKISDYLFLNDSCDGRGLSEVAVLHVRGKTGSHATCDQLESITLDLYEADELRNYIEQIMKLEVIPYGEETVIVETPSEHRGCAWCA